MAKWYLKAQILDDPVPVLLEKNTANSLLSAFSSSSKLFVDAIPNLLEVSCTRIQAPACTSKSFSHHPNSTQFKYFEFSLPNSKVEFVKGASSKTPLNQSNKKGEPFFDSPFSVSSEELVHLDRSTELESQKRFKPFGPVW